ncbi:GumC family protein [Candidatus Poribacteria bacterium]
MQMEQMEARTMGFKDYLTIFLDRKWIILLVFLLITASAVYYAETAQPMYQTMAVLMSESNVMTASVFPMMNPFYYRGPLEYLTNLQRLMLTGEFATSVVEKMSKEHGIDIGISAAQTGVRLNNPETTQIIEVIARSGEPRRAAALANSVAEAVIEKTSEIKNSDTNRALMFLESQLEVVDENLRDAEEKLNTFKEDEGILAGMTTTVDTSSFGSQLGNERYVRASLVGHLTQLQAQVTYAQSERELAQAQLDSVNSMIAEKRNQLALTKEVDYLVGSVTPQIAQLQQKIAAWQVELAVLEENFTDKHPQVVELKQRVENAQEQLKSELTGLVEQKGVSASVDPISEWQSLVDQAVQLTVKLRGAENQENFATSKFEKFKEDNPDLLDKEVELVRLEREARIREKTYMLLTDRREEMLLLKQVNAQQFRLVDEAFAPRYPVSPNKTRIITLGVILGLMLGCAVAFVLEHLDDSVRRVDDVEKVLGLPIVGSVPKIQAAANAQVALPQANDSTSQSLSAISPERTKKQNRETRKRLELLQGRLIKNVGSKSPVAESYRSLWTNIQFADLDNPVKTILVTSPGPKEGKSLTTANLALTIAQSDLRVLVIDADLRRPTVHRLFGCHRSPGLSELITGDVSNIEEYVSNTYADNLYVLPGGVLPPNPVGILGSDKMKQLVAEAARRFDVVLFDSPPVIAMADASILATGLDLTLLVLQAGQTKRQVAMQAKALMERLNINIFGVVLNGVDYSKRYGYHYYYYHYHNYYTSEERDEAV